MHWRLHLKRAAALLFLGGIGVVAGPLSWETAGLSAGRVSLESGAWREVRSLGAANFSAEFCQSFRLEYDSEVQRVGVAGYGWTIPLLESRFSGSGERMTWRAPWGAEIGFVRREGGSYVSDADFEAGKEGEHWILRGSGERRDWVFTYRGSVLESAKAPSGRVLAFEYDVLKRPVSVAEQGRAMIQLAYDGNTRQASKITVSGVEHVLTYAVMKVESAPRSHADALAGKVEAERPVLVSLRKADLDPIAFEYNAFGYLTRAGATKFTVETASETVQKKFFEEVRSRQSRGLGVSDLHPAQRTGRLLADGVSNYAYPQRGLTVVTDAAGRKSEFRYDAKAGRLSVKNAAGQERIFSYFRRFDVAYNGKLRQIADNRGRKLLQVEYDHVTGLPTSALDALGNRILNEYDGSGRLVKVSRQAKGGSVEPVASFGYDAAWNLTNLRRLDASGEAVREQVLAYDAHRAVVSATDGRGHTILVRNDFGYPAEIKDPFGMTTRITYDAFNRVTKVVNAYGVATSYEYAASGAIANIATAETSLAIRYDGEGRPVEYSDGAGRVKSLTYNDLSRVVAEVFPDGTKTEYDYTATGALAKVLDPNGNPIEFRHNEFGMASRLTAAGQLTRYVHDAHGLMQSVISEHVASGEVARAITLKRDAFDRVVEVSYGKDQTEKYSYDRWGRIAKAFKVMPSETRSAEYVYDYFGRLTESSETAQGGDPIVKRYQYDAYDQRTRLETVNGSLKIVEERTFDSFGRLAEIVSGTNTVTYHYNDKNQLARRVSNSIPTFYTYTEFGALKTKILSEPAIAKLEYFYAKDGQIAAREVNGKRQEYKYDLKGQLLEVVGAEKYVYDPAGNILEKTVNGKKTTYAYDKANQLVSSTTDGKTTKYAYDAAGRLVKEGDKVYTYAWLDKITQVTEGEKLTGSYTYGLDGQLATATQDGKSESFLWDGLALIARNETKFVNEPYVTGGNPILADNTLLFNDMLGSTLGRAENGSYAPVAMTAFGETSDRAAFFTGKPAVGELGYSFLFRNYRSDLAKWQTQDPLGYPDGWNNFAYVNNEVTTELDRLGLAEVWHDFSFTYTQEYTFGGAGETGIIIPNVVFPPGTNIQELLAGAVSDAAKAKLLSDLLRPFLIANAYGGYQETKPDVTFQDAYNQLDKEKIKYTKIRGKSFVLESVTVSVFGGMGGAMIYGVTQKWKITIQYE